MSEKDYKGGCNMIGVYDYHLHSDYSNDAVDSMECIAKRAAGKNFTEIAFTDHIELRSAPIEFIKKKLKRQYNEFSDLKERYKGRISLKFGMEAGGVLWDIDATNEIAGFLDYDFIIFSLHLVRGGVDYYDMDYGKADIRYEALKYINELSLMVDTFSNSSAFSVLGHIDYLSRYIRKYGLDFDFNGLKDKFVPIFEKLIENGRGIELNTSGLRSPRGATMPSREILEVYRECGGEIVTVGSDAHRAVEAGENFYEAIQLLRETGFTKLTKYDKMKAEFINL
jgi:histidinol-phosphatase (PHP family)